jgi:hypothetical protein
MTLIAGLPGYVSASSNGHIGGILGTRLKGPALSGQVENSTANIPGPGAGYICIQSTASVVNNVLSTLDAVIGSRASFVYIPVTTGPLAGSAAPPYVGCGTPLVWNDDLKQLMVWSSGAVSWMTLIATTSMSAGGFTTSA